MNNLLAMSQEMTGLFGFFIGIIIVFLGIALLVFVVWAIGVIINAVNKPKTSQEKNVQPVAESTANISAQDETIPDHVKVAITAAIYAYYSEQQEKCEFTVRKIVRR